MRINRGFSRIGWRALTMPLTIASTILLAVILFPADGAFACDVHARQASRSGTYPLLTQSPSDLDITRYGDDYLVTWKPVGGSGIAGYNVYRTFLPYSFLTQWGKLNQTAITGRSFLNTGAGKRRWRLYYWVAPVDVKGQAGAMAGPVGVDPRLPDTDPPMPPRNPQAGALEAGVSLTWDSDNSEPDFAGYCVYACGQGEDKNIKLDPDPLMDDFYYWDLGKAGDTFRICSVDTSGNQSEGVTAIASELPEEILDFVDPLYNQDPRVEYAGYWKDESYAGSYGGQLIVCGGEDDSVKVDFIGRSVELLSVRYWQCGLCEVFLDGNSRGVVSLHSDDTSYHFPVFRDYSLRPGPHELKLVNLGVPGEEGFPYDIINIDYLVLR